MGDRFASVAFALFAVASSSPSFLAMVLIADLLPPLLFGLVGGLLVDKYFHRYTWPLALVGQAFCFIGMAYAASSAVIIVFVAASSTISALVGPMGHVLLKLVSQKDAGAVIARWAAVADGVAAIGGTIAGAAAFSVAAKEGLFLVNAASFLLLAVIGLLATTSVRKPEGEPGQTSEGTVRQAILGFRRLLSPTAFGISGVLLLVGVMLGTSLEGVINVFFVRDYMQLDPLWYGIVLAAWSAGTLLGPALFKESLVARFHWRSVLLASGTVMGFGIAFPAVAPAAYVLLVAYILGGAANGLFNYAIGAAIFTGVAETEQGRAWTAFGMLFSACALVGYLVGALIGPEYARLTILVTGAVPVLVCAVAYKSQRRHVRALATDFQSLAG